MDDCMLLQRFGGHLQGKGLLVEQLVSISIEAIAHAKIHMVLERMDVPIAVLNRLSEELEGEFSDRGVIIDLETEKMFWYHEIQLGFTDDGKGNGRVLGRGLPLVTKDVRSFLANFFLCGYPDRREAVAMIDEYFEQAGRLLEKTPSQLRTEGELEMWNDLGKKSAMLHLLGPAHGGIYMLSWRLRTSRRALLTVLAVLRYEKERGEYPMGLYELVKGGYLKTLPIDPFSDKALVYKQTDSGFTLYSMGANFADDGGVSGKDRKGKFKLWPDAGDAVFWSVQ